MAIPDYSLNLPNPVDEVNRYIGLQRNEVALQGERQAQQAAAQQAEAQQRQQEILQQDLGELQDNPTSAGILRVMTRHPQLSKQMESAYGVLSSEQKKTKISQASRVYAALQAGNSGLAKDILIEQATAHENSGDTEEAKVLRDLAVVAENNPAVAQTTAGMLLASAMGPEEFSKTFGGLQKERREQELQGATLTKAEADAERAAVLSGYAESQQIADLEKKGWEIEKFKNDIEVSKQNKKIAAASQKLQKESNELKKQELESKIQDMKLKRDQTLRDQAAKVESSNFAIDNAINTLDRVLSTPEGVQWWATGPVLSKFPTLDEDVANFEELINTVKAQSFLSQVQNMAGLGALSDAEGKKLTEALQNFSLRQSPERLKKNVKEAQRLLMKARESVRNKYGQPPTTPDTPDVMVFDEDIDELINRYAN